MKTTGIAGLALCSLLAGCIQHTVVPKNAMDPMLPFYGDWSGVSGGCDDGMPGRIVELRYDVHHTDFRLNGAHYTSVWKGDGSHAGSGTEFLRFDVLINGKWLQFELEFANTLSALFLPDPEAWCSEDAHLYHSASPTLRVSAGGI